MYLHFTMYTVEWASSASNLLILDAMTDLCIHQLSFLNKTTWKVHDRNGIWDISLFQFLRDSEELEQQT